MCSGFFSSFFFPWYGDLRDLHGTKHSFPTRRSSDLLEKEHADRPHRGAPPEPRKDYLGDKRLHLEEQEGAQEDRNGVEDHEEKGKGDEGRRVAPEYRPMLRSICRTLRTCRGRCRRRSGNSGR